MTTASWITDEDAIVPIGRQEIAALCRVKIATVDQWRQRGVLPEPRWTVSGRPVWAQQDIVTWAAATGRHVPTAAACPARGR